MIQFSSQTLKSVCCTTPEEQGSVLLAFFVVVLLKVYWFDKSELNVCCFSTAVTLIAVIELKIIDLTLKLTCKRVSRAISHRFDETLLFPAPAFNTFPSFHKKINSDTLVLLQQVVNPSTLK